MSGRVVVLNGASSSGKTTLCRALQGALAGTWFTFGVDAFLSGSPIDLYEREGGISFPKDGKITRGAEYHALYDTWRASIRALVDGGMNILLDEVFLDGSADQEAWRRHLPDDTLWVAVHCDADEAERRELERGDRNLGMARYQTGVVHDGVTYDLELDNAATPTPDAVAQIVTAARERWGDAV